MTTMTTTATCKVRIDWRHDGQLGYRETTIDEVRGWGDGHLGLYTSLTASTPSGEVTAAEGLVWFPGPPVGPGATSSRWIVSGDDEIRDFVAIVDRIDSGETPESIYESF